MTTSRRARLVQVAVLATSLPLLAAVLSGCGRETPPADTKPKVTELVSSLRAEPRTFNRYAGRDSVLEVVTHLTQAKLVRIDRQTQELQPWLAESWTASADGLTFTLKLRPGVTFSDGTPFTSADVLFAFRAIYDEKMPPILGEAMRVGGKPLASPPSNQLQVLSSRA